MSIRVTPAMIRGMEPGTAWDSEQRGLGVRVNQNGTGVFIAKYRVGKRQIKRVLARVNEITLKAARAKVAEVMVAAQKGEDILEPVVVDQPETITVEDALDQYFLYFQKLVDEGERKPRTLLDYRRQAARTIRPAIGSMRVSDVRRVDVRRTLDTIGGKVQQNRQRAMLASFFTWTEDEDVAHRPPGSNPVAGIKKKREQPRDRLLTAREQVRLSKAIEDTVTDRRAALAIQVMMLSGWRVGEVRTLRWTDLDLDEKRAVLADTKTGRSIRRIPTEVCDMLAMVEPVDGNPFVFAGDRGAAIGERKLGILFRAACAAAGIEDGQLRDLRRTYATDLAANGVNPFHIRDALGHRSLAMTDKVYVRLAGGEVLGEELDRAAERRAARQADNVVPITKRRAS